MENPITVRVGKNGVTPALINEIRAVLKKHKRIRVKLLKTSLMERGKDEVTEEIRKACRARKAAGIGHTITFES